MPKIPRTNPLHDDSFETLGALILMLGAILLTIGALSIFICLVL